MPSGLTTNEHAELAMRELKPRLRSLGRASTLLGKDGTDPKRPYPVIDTLVEHRVVKEPAEVTSGDVIGFIASQRTPRVSSKVVSHLRR
jgi:hypothetical protein